MEIDFDNLYHGPVQPYSPTPEQAQQIEQMLASDDELYRAYGEVYKAGCFVTEFNGIAAVGSMDQIEIIEFRTGEPVNTNELSMGDCVNMGTFPGRGEDRAERVLNGLHGYLETINNNHSLIKHGSFTENGYRFEAYMPGNNDQPLQWTIKIFKEGEDEEISTETVPMFHPPVFGPDAEDCQSLELFVDQLVKELTKM